MTFLLNCVIQVTVVLSIALTSLSLLRKRSAALRHCVLSTAILFSILMPAFNLLVPVWNLNEVVSRHSNIIPIREQLSAWTAWPRVKDMPISSPYFWIEVRISTRSLPATRMP